ncbi:MAG TPA: 16S rRNA (guanine(527)-N(7))-methyltransferase RsmG [Candidatus Sulfotelmatobacter sp.]|nr:16S rRNA (guanine(527)-N(7))-methyltransferase RsmG [Candidatus Sulfotelmatobacter sp.]
MRSARIAELLEPFLSNTCHSESGQRPGEEPAVLSSSQLDHISTYIDLLIRWNSRINLTAIRDAEEIVTRHFGESLFAARHLFPATAPVGTAAPGCPAERSSAVRLADLGSGAGFPGIPIKLWAPAIALTLIESNHKKAIFLREVVRSLTLTNVDIQNTRAETITQTYEVVTLRAVEHFGDALRVAASLTTPTGRLALLIGSSRLDEAHSTLPPFTWQKPLHVPQSQSRILLMGAAAPIR